MLPDLARRCPAGDPDDHPLFVSLGCATENLSQVPLRPALAAALGLAGQRPELVVRFGRGPALPRSLRRPVESVLVSANEELP